MVSEEVARSLQSVLDYAEEDPRRKHCRLSRIVVIPSAKSSFWDCPRFLRLLRRLRHLVWKIVERTVHHTVIGSGDTSIVAGRQVSASSDLRPLPRRVEPGRSARALFLHTDTLVGMTDHVAMSVGHFCYASFRGARAVVVSRTMGLFEVAWTAIHGRSVCHAS